MAASKKIKLTKTAQYTASILFVLLVAVISFFFKELIGYKVVALILMVTVSLLAMLMDILPVLIAAVLSALIWNFFFIPPIFTFHIKDTEDLLMFLMYFIIAMVNAVLTFKIREQEKKARDEKEKEKTIKLYNVLFNSLSHELRTPIATIIGAVDTLKENRQKLSEVNQNILLSEIDTASLRLNRQVENLLNMSRLETGILKPNFIWCDVNEIIFAVIETFKETNKTHQLLFTENEKLPLVKLDVGFMEQILNNIIYNAIQYTPEKSIIKISVQVENQICKWIIEDNGNGFEEKVIPFVFDKFYRVSNSKTGGTGLGLSIVKGYVKAQNGIVWVENIKSGGAKFIIEISSETSYINNIKNE